MLLTCICILAVDFRIFPRRFAKTEMFGTSLMDIGIGGFIVSSAITSKFARGVDSHPVKSPCPLVPCHSNRLFRIFSLRYVAVFVLGIGRMIVIKVLNYHEKVSEYGQHWNFFVTLSTVWVIADLVHLIVPRRFIVSVSLCWLIAYQFLLSQTKLTYYIFSAPRTNFLSANREGICSLIGFLPLYLMVESFSSRYIFTGTTQTIASIEAIDTKDSQASLLSTADVEKNSESAAQVFDAKDDSKQHTYLWIPMPPYHYRLCRALTYATAFAWISWLLLARIQPTSRRLTNSTYIMLVLAMSSSLLLFIIIADVAAGVQTRVASLTYINSHQLVVFLGCNLITGAVNMSMKTIYVDRYLSSAILAAYCFMILAIAWITQHIQERHVDLNLVHISK
jgi:glucosaminylphosphatidylinositol acyltransferase